MSPHASNIAAQLRAAEQDERTPEEHREELGDRADGLEAVIGPDVESDGIPNVLLSIKPVHAESILSGEKAWEYRRRAPAAEPPYRVVLYASAPISAAIGACWVVDTCEGSPKRVIADTIDGTPHDHAALAAYFDDVYHANALRVVDPARFETAVDRDVLVGADVAPTANFRYLPDVPRAMAVDAGVIADG